MKACLQLCANRDIVGRLYDMEAFGAVSSDLSCLFPYNVMLSEGVSAIEWSRSILVQPSVFIRIRKQKDEIIKLLNTAAIPYSFVTDNCIELPNGAKIDTLLPSSAYVVQDASSQLTGRYFAPVKGERWYDSCSGAGGKSLLLKDMEPTVQLTVTDVRDTILYNLKERFREYGHKAPAAFVTDVTDKAKLAKSLDGRQFDNIICDAPCSGSGTWARTPEQMYFFNPVQISKFSTLQKNIAVNVAAYLKQGGRLIYITCSVFQDENEHVVDEIINKTGLKLLEAKLINGIAYKADSMFIAVLQR
jgi:16S rRNA (cytosine967-C5)-methyltransferase